MSTTTFKFNEKLHAAVQKIEGVKEEIYKVGDFFRLISLISPSEFDLLSVDPDSDEDYMWYARGAVYGYDGIPCLYAIEPIDDFFRFPKWVQQADIDEWEDPRRCLRGGRLYVEPGLFCDDQLSIGYWLGSTFKDSLKHPWLSTKGVDVATSEFLALYRLAISETERRCALFEELGKPASN